MGTFEQEIMFNMIIATARTAAFYSKADIADCSIAGSSFFWAGLVLIKHYNDKYEIQNKY